MPVIPNASGTINPLQGIVAEATFIPATATQEGVRGQCPPPPVGADGTYFLAGDRVWRQITSGAFIPVIRFTGNATGGTGQTFTDPTLGRYTKAEDIQLFVRGTTPIRLFGDLSTGSPDFTLSGSTITVSYNLPANALLFIDSKVITGATETFYILTEDLNAITAENDNRLVQQASPLGEANNEEP